VVGAFVIAVLVVSCAAGGPENDDDGRGGERGAVTTKEETTTPEGERSTAQTAQKPLGFDSEVVSPVGRGNRPEGFGEGTLWATGFDYSPTSGNGQGSSAAGETNKTLLKRVDPRTGEVVAEIPIEGVKDIFDPELAFGAGSVWVCAGMGSRQVVKIPHGARRHPGDVVVRVDPETNRVVDRIPVDSPTGLAFGHGSVWVASAVYGTVSRIDPQTDKVVAKIEVGQGAVDIATDESSGAVWVAGVTLSPLSDYLTNTSGTPTASASSPASRGSPENHEDNRLSRVDPATNRVVAEIPIPDAQLGGATNVVVGEGAVWALSEDGRLLKVDPEIKEVAAMVSVGKYSSSLLEVYGGGVWTMLQTSAGSLRLVRVDPRTVRIVAYEYLRPTDEIAPGALAAGGGYVWFTSGDGLARVAP